jgi:hypothetical protein
VPERRSHAFVGASDAEERSIGGSETVLDEPRRTGDVTLNLTFTGHLEAGPGNTVVRTAGSTTITGTATSSSGTYNVMVTL